MKLILFADNTPDFLLTRAEYLEGRGYQVEKIFSLKDARRLLKEAYAHLAILDIRLQNDDDEKDVSGLILAKDPAFQAIPKIILTSYPTVEAVKEALGPALIGLPPAVDFISKQQGPQAMLEAVEQAFEKFIRINWELEIQWDPREPLSFPHLANLIQPGLPTQLLFHRASELEDLLRKLFFHSQKIRFGQLLWHDSRRICLPVISQSMDGATDQRILVMGDRELLAREKENIRLFAPDTDQEAVLRGEAETVHFGANLYRLAGAEIETLQTLRNLLETGRERFLKTALTNLVGNVLKTWHAHGQLVEGHANLMSIYRRWTSLSETDYPRERVDEQVDALIQSALTLGAVEIQRGQAKISFKFPHQTAQIYPDPVAVLYATQANLTLPIICRVSPGQVTADNVLIDAERNAWISDFLHAGQAPQWWDYICLEAMLRFEVRLAVDLGSWREFETCLVKPGYLDEKLETDDVVPELRIKLELIEQVRRQAALEAGGETQPYYMGLLAWVVGAMARYDLNLISTQADKQRCAHLLLGACLLAERLGNPEEPSSQSGVLRLSEDGRVFLGDRPVKNLSGLRLKLFECLYAQAGKTVSIRWIVENVYGEKYDALDRDQNQRIRQEIRRLRENIEPNLDRPQYILTLREKGYRLEVDGNSRK